MSERVTGAVDHSLVHQDYGIQFTVTGFKHEKKPVRKQKRDFWFGFLAAIGVLLVLAAGGFAGMMRLEETNTFCASCHTEPETEYVARMGQTAADLAAFHQVEEQVNCIDCHSGPGLGGRAIAMLTGARNAALYVTKTMTQPARSLGPFSDGSCTKCHADITRGERFNGRDNHFHAFLSDLKRRQPAQALRCVDCHDGHATDVEAQLLFLNRARTEAACERCHNALGEGGEGDEHEGREGGDD